MAATKICWTLICCLGAVRVFGQVITTVVGTDWVFPAKSTPAGNAPLGDIGAVAVDAKGNVYAADTGNNTVFRIAPDGTLTVIAGNGLAGYSGDGGPATSASLSLPYGIALDAAGNLFISDNLSVVRKVKLDGTIATIAGHGIQGFSGDGGPATNASLSDPKALAVDRFGNLYIADILNARVRKVALDGTITTVAGNGHGGYSGDGGEATSAQIEPWALAVDAAGTLYIGDATNQVVRKVGANGLVSTLIGFHGSPLGLTIGASGNLFIADAAASAIQEITSTGIVKIAGGSQGFFGDGGSAATAGLNLPSGVALDAAGNIYIADSANRRIRQVSLNGIIRTLAGNGVFRFSGDGGPAINAALNNPEGVALDSTGNLFIADTFNYRVRKVNPEGIITTVAGNGVSLGSGDGGQATMGSLVLPVGLAVGDSEDIFIADLAVREVNTLGTIMTLRDRAGSSIVCEGITVGHAGDLYAANFACNCIQKLSSDGSITAIAGNGKTGFSGDAGPATSAELRLGIPTGLAIDSAGNLYIADGGNNRIRKVTPLGVITTVAGSSSSGYSGDGGPATDASLNDPRGVAVDGDGSVYIADTNNNVIRRVSAGGIITTVAGNGRAGSSGDGRQAVDAALNLPYSVAVNSTGDLYILDGFNNRIRRVLKTPPYFVNISQSMTLGAAAGSKPDLGRLTISGTLNAQSGSTVPGMAYTAQVSSNSPWLSVLPQRGSTPGLITVKADPFNIAPGNYQGVITITLPDASPSVRTVNVQFAVGQPVSASLGVDRDHLSFTYANTSVARSQTITVSNLGGGPLPFTTSVVLDSGQAAKWLNVTAQSSSATPSNPVVLDIRADPGSFAPGTYTGNVTITGTTPGTGSISVPVTMTITPNPLILLLSKTGFTFTAVQNGGVVPGQTFGVVNLGAEVLSWTVETSTLAGRGWLNATPNIGVSNAGSGGGVPLVTVSVNATGLQPGVYYGLVKVRSAGAANTPQEVVVVLQILPVGTDDDRTRPIIQPTSLVFTGTVGNSSPGSQDVLVYDPTGANKSFRSGKTTVGGGDWFVTLPGEATIARDQPTRIVVQPLVNNLGPGTYQGTLSLEFSDGWVSTVGITFVVTAVGTSRQSSGTVKVSRGSEQHPADITTGVCTPKQLLPSLISLGTGFSVAAGFPQGLEAQVVDDCGTPHLSGTVFVEFSNGDPPVKLSSLNNGRWDGTWKTSAHQISRVTLTVTAKNPNLQLQGGNQVTGGLGAQQPAPVVSENGVVSAASLVQQIPLAPGGLISIFGKGMSLGTSSAPSGSLPTLLADTIVTIGDQILPLLYSSDGQVNAKVPYGINANTNQQLLVQRGLTYATPVYIDVAAAQPAIFKNGEQALITDAMGTLIGPGNPAHAGKAIIIYCAGLGAVNPLVPDGVLTPDSPLSNTVNTVTVTIGGKSAPVAFAGLSPRFAGLYQVNVTVPQEAANGGQLTLLISTAGQTSAPVNITVK